MEYKTSPSTSRRDITSMPFQSVMARPVSVIAPASRPEKVATVKAVASYSLSPPSIVLSLDPASAVEETFGLSVLSTGNGSAVGTVLGFAPVSSDPMDPSSLAVAGPLLHLSCQTSFALETAGGLLLVAKVDEISFGEGRPLVWLDGEVGETRVISQTSQELKGFPDAMASLASAVYVVTGWDGRERPRGFTATSVLPHGADEGAVVVSIDCGAFSHDALVGGDYICLNLLGDHQSETARLFASKRADKFENSEWSPVGSMPVLAGTAGFAVCRVSQIVRHGDHTMVVAEIAESEVTGTLPLLYWRRNFGSLEPTLLRNFSPIGGRTIGVV